MRNFLLLILLPALASCSQDYDIVLPENEPQLVVECYLEDGQPLRALVTESTALLSTALLPPIVTDAVVTITHGGLTDTLLPSIYLDLERSRVYNYGSSKVVTADYSSGESYRIDVYDSKGRHASGTTYFIGQAHIAGITTMKNADDNLACITTILDDPGRKNYYQLILKRNSRTDSIRQNYVMADELASSQGRISIRSAYRFRAGDSIYASLYHLTPEHYQFLNTSQSARSALGNPFAASGEVVSNISGGLGVFAALAVTEYATRVD